MELLDLQEKKLAELRDIARAMNLKGFSTLRKQDLIYTIIEAQAKAGARSRASRKRRSHPIYGRLVRKRSASHRHRTRRLNVNRSRMMWLRKQAIEVFRSEEKAQKWFETPFPVLGGKTPLECFETEEGAQEVADMLGRIAHGVFS